MTILGKVVQWWRRRSKPLYSRNFIQLFGTIMLVLGFGLGSWWTVTEIFIPKISALDDTTHTWTMDGDNLAHFTYSSETITIGESGATVNNGNLVSNPDFQSDVSNWSVKAIPPSGWVEVPGNDDYSTDNFLVMQYEAKYDCTDDDDGDTATTCSAPADSGTLGMDYRDLSGFSASNVVSTANGAPIVHITQEQAISVCSSVSIGSTTAHLITNAEWMTMARNIDQQAANWSGGNVGSGGIFRGNVGNDDTLGYNGTDPEYGTGRDEKAKLVLSNGSEVWDLSGNVWNWNSDTIYGDAKPVGNSYAWVEWPTVSDFNGSSAGVGDSSAYLPTNSSWTSSNGIGRYYEGSSSGGPYAFLRGGYWSNASSAGLFALSLSLSPALQNSSVGFRCASDSVDILQSFQSNLGKSGGGNLVSAGEIADGLVYQSINVGGADSTQISVYVKNNDVGSSAVDGTIARLYYNGSEVETSYDDSDNDEWYKLSATVTGADESREFGLVVGKGEAVLVDDWTIATSAEHSFYTDVYSNAQVESWDSLSETATTDGYSSVKYQLCPNDPDDESVGCETQNSWQWWDGASWSVASGVSEANTIDELTTQVMQQLDTTSQKVAVKIIMGFGSADVPYLSSLQLGLTTDTVVPETQASATKFKRTAGAEEEYVYDEENIEWTNNLAPYFSWTAGADSGSGLAGYCLYLGLDVDASYNATGVSEGNPNGTYLGTSPVSTTGTDCNFIIGSNSIDFATVGYRGASWLETSSSAYYLKIWAVDNGGNVAASDPAVSVFKFDNTRPTNVGYISPASGSFSNVVDMNFSWPISGSGAATDDNSGILGWQYQINSTSGSWLGTQTHSIYDFDYIPSGTSTYTLTAEQDEDSIVSGDNIIYLRAVDQAGNFSTEATIRTGKLAYGGDAPQFGDTDQVTVTPSSTDTNSFTLSWPEAEATVGQEVAGYYFMVNTTPPSSYATLIGNQATYIPNGTALSVAARALPNVNKGSNTVYVVAVDDDNNYSPSNYISGSFTLNSTDPDNVGSLVASDSSIKAQSQWNVTLTWTAPSYQGAGNLSYNIYRSEDGSSFELVGSTSGLSYVDTTPESKLYYFKIYSEDGAEATSSGSNAVTITPTGKWTTAASLTADPETSSITTKRAKISWSTSRGSDSKIAYGTGSGDYYDEEPSNSDQVTSHVINLTNLSPGTKYYYKAKWTDEDGNTGESEEKHFTTDPAPTVKDVAAKNIGLSSAILDFTTNGASSVKIYYGISTDFGAVKEVSTGTGESSYNAELANLLDGTKYYYKINTIDSEGDEYEGTILDFTTLPRPRISAVRVQQVKNTAQPTILVSWQSNTDISSIVSYWPTNDSTQARDEVDVTRVNGSHEMLIKGLLPETNYRLQVKGRDKVGNEAVSDVISLTTATDTRPPLISDVTVESATIPPNRTAGQESVAQLVVAWNTDEPATSQVEFGEGSGTSYAQTTQMDSNLTYNHLVVISNLTPSKVYHLRVISKDAAGNESKSIDNVTITSKATDNALDLVITNLVEAFGFLGGLWR